MTSGKAIIVSAPSGSGKTTLVKHLTDVFPHLEFSISACTRPRRGRNEIHGKDYYFLSPDEFRQYIDKDAFIEWEEVYKDSYYGTLKSEADRIWSKGNHLIADVDVKGGLSLKRHFGDQALAIFIKAPSLEIIEQRLRSRDTEDEEQIQRRIDKAGLELAFEPEFEVVITNDDLEKTKQNIEEIVGNFLSKE